MPDGDLFRAMRAGRASVVTDEVVKFTPHGILLKSGRELPADIIVTATGLNLLAWGGIRLDVDGTVLEPGRCLTYKGLMLSNVPNCAVCAGYANASWTLRRSCRRSMSVGCSGTWNAAVTRSACRAATRIRSRPGRCCP